MHNRLGAAALLMIALLGAGCKKADPIVGKWTASPNGATIAFEFKPENAFTMTMGIMGKSLVISGDYKHDGEKLTLSPKDVTSPGATADQLKTAKTQLAGQTQEMTVKFPSDDQISLTPTGGKTGMAPGMTLTRVKDGG